MDNLEIQRERVPETSAAIRRFAALPLDRLEMALLILRGIQIGEDIYAQNVRPNA